MSYEDESHQFTWVYLVYLLRFWQKRYPPPSNSSIECFLGYDIPGF